MERLSSLRTRERAYYNNVYRGTAALLVSTVSSVSTFGRSLRPRWRCGGGWQGDGWRDASRLFIGLLQCGELW